VISRDAVHAHVKRQQEFAKPVVGFAAAILNKIAGDHHAFCAPITGIVMVKYLLQGIRSDSAPKFAGRVGEQVWVGQVQNPNRITALCVGGRWNKLLP
jgi:hypothetical protein